MSEAMRTLFLVLGLSATLGGVCLFLLSLASAVWFCFRWHPRFGFAFAGIRGLVLLSLASALWLWFASVAPVRGGTYFSLPPQRKVGKRKRLTPPILVLA
ncbi:hypothetical protein CBA19CS91_18845 [Paraburkholderia hospita]|nr:hypothetical protein CBA19CS91_18845 [Paraburkholderia hospita]